MKETNKVLYWVCTVSIVVLGVLLLVAVWSETDNEYLWKAIGTDVVIFCAALLVLCLNLLMMRIRKRSQQGQKDVGDDSHL